MEAALLQFKNQHGLFISGIGSERDKGARRYIPQTDPSLALLTKFTASCVANYYPISHSLSLRKTVARFRFRRRRRRTSLPFSYAQSRLFQRVTALPFSENEIMERPASTKTKAPWNINRDEFYSMQVACEQRCSLWSILVGFVRFILCHHLSIKYWSQWKFWKTATTQSTIFNFDSQYFWGNRPF